MNVHIQTSLPSVYPKIQSNLSRIRKLFCFPCRREAAAVNANRAVKKLKDELDEAESRATGVSKVSL